MFEELKEKPDRNRSAVPGQEVTELQVGSTDLSNPKNLQVKTASLELTHRTTFQDVVTSPIKTRLPPEKFEMNTEGWQTVIDKLAAEGVEQVILTGGEPTLREDFHTILQYAINHIEDVVVQTAGGTDRNLSRFDCTVSVPLDYWDMVDNNELRRMTHPEKWVYNRNKGVLERKNPTKCDYCDTDFDNMNGVKGHIAKAHKKQIIEDFNRETGADVEDYDELKSHERFDWEMFLNQEEPIPIPEKEFAKRLARRKIENVDNPVVIRTNIMNNNDIDKIVAYAQTVGADVTFKPLYPNGNELLEEQIPSPKRFAKVMEKVWQLDGTIKEKLRIDNPHYKAFERRADLENGIKPTHDEETYREWLRRGRVSEVGVSHIDIMPNGSVLPSKYLREDEYILGNLVNKAFESIYEEMAKFNEAISKPEKDHRPFEHKYPDIRRRSLAGDPNIYLNKSYEHNIQGGEQS